MNFLAVYKGKLLVNAGAIISQEHKIVAKVNDSLLYSVSYGKKQSGLSPVTHIFQNGHLNQTLLSSTGIFYGTNEFNLFVNISTYQEDETGEYFVIEYTNTFQLLVNGCTTSSFYFVHNYLETFELIQYAAALQILTAGK